MAPRLAAREAFQNRRFAEAEQILLQLFDQRDTNSQVLGALAQFYMEVGRGDDLVAKFSERLKKEPWNWSLSLALSQVYEERKQRADAVRMLDETRAIAAVDPDLLYTLSGYYTRLGQSAASEQMLQQVLKLDAAYPGANNDLGYAWAEQGRNLPEAEALVRKALQLEPENLSFLDSLGWVLYKRGKFAEAAGMLTRAAHLGDSAGTR